MADTGREGIAGQGPAGGTRTEGGGRQAARATRAPRPYLLTRFRPRKTAKGRLVTKDEWRRLRRSTYLYIEGMKEKDGEKAIKKLRAIPDGDFLEAAAEALEELETDETRTLRITDHGSGKELEIDVQAFPSVEDYTATVRIDLIDRLENPELRELARLALSRAKSLGYMAEDVDSVFMGLASDFVENEDEVVGKMEAAFGKKDADATRRAIREFAEAIHGRTAELTEDAGHDETVRRLEGFKPREGEERLHALLRRLVEFTHEHETEFDDDYESWGCLKYDYRDFVLATKREVPTYEISEAIDLWCDGEVDYPPQRYTVTLGADGTATTRDLHKELAGLVNGIGQEVKALAQKE